MSFAMSPLPRQEFIRYRREMLQVASKLNFRTPAREVRSGLGKDRISIVQTGRRKRGKQGPLRHRWPDPLAGTHCFIHSSRCAFRMILVVNHAQVRIDTTSPDFIAWDDINGIDEVKSEITEIIEYLRVRGVK
jgi:hypothetical protein